MSSLFALGCPVLDPSARAAHEEADALRVQGPAVPVELPGGVRAWSVTRHAVIKALTSDRRVSRDFRQHWPGRADVPDDWPLAVLTLQKGIFNAYGPAHRRLRRTIAPWFSPQRVEELRPQVQSAADRLIADLAATAPGEPVDLRHALSLPLAMRVICDLFGVPAFLREPLGAAMDALVATTADTEQVRARQGELQFRIGQLLQYKTAHPGTDLTSDLLAPSAGDTEPIPARELRDTLSFVLGAGYETSVNLITGAVHAMLAQPQYLARIGRGGGSGGSGGIGWDDVIEETLRHDGPVMHMPLRYAVEDIDLGEGIVIRRGEPIIIAFAAAGRDPDLHPDRPGVFDPTRADKGHLAFGHGPHFCVGAHLARLEARIALATLFDCLPDLALAHRDQSPPPIPSFLVNGPAHLHVIPVPLARG
ncbi:cytochrome P450 [Streptomyces sp. NBC_00435]|uniref:cytochrome P450 family protein n=1 Tax=Streptomyces sp. NBC_00435 TaxID=2903649 RepID=UPI002E206F46